MEKEKEKPKKPFKITKSELFLEQEKKLPPEIREEITKAIKEIVKNPMGAEHTMSILGEPTPQELKQWIGKDTTPEIIELVLEYLDDKYCLNEKGKKLYADFWRQE